MNRLKCHLLQSIILLLSLIPVNVIDYHFHLLPRITIKLDGLMVLSKSSLLGWFLHVSLIVIIKERSRMEVSLIVIIKKVST
jgi:hypothetical protein